MSRTLFALPRDIKCLALPDLMSLKGLGACILEGSWSTLGALWARFRPLEEVWGANWVPERTWKQIGVPERLGAVLELSWSCLGAVLELSWGPKRDRCTYFA